jgi:hypothetical protein
LVELAQDVDEFRRHRVETAVVLTQRVTNYFEDRRESLIDAIGPAVRAAWAHRVRRALAAGVDQPTEPGFRGALIPSVSG